MEPVKRYFVTEEIEPELPNDFYTSKNRKYITIKYVELLEVIETDTSIVINKPSHVSLHSNIVNVYNYCDSYVMPVNVFNIEQKYEQLINMKKIKFWVKQFDGTEIPIGKKIVQEDDGSTIKFQIRIKMLLQF